MIELGVEWDKSLTLDELDQQYDTLKKRVQEADKANALLKPLVADPARATLGAILAEAISAAFWSDATMVSPVAIVKTPPDERCSSTRWRAPCCMNTSYKRIPFLRWAWVFVILQ